MVFISHASKDRAVALALCDALERDKIACWIAPRDPVAGVDYAPQIISAIE